MKPIAVKVAIILVGVLLVISSGHLKVEGAEPPELSGPDKMVEKLSSEEKKLGLAILNAFELLPKSAERSDAQKIKEAISRLDKVIESNPEYSDAYFMRAMVYFHFQGSKDYERIIKDLDNAIKFYPSKKYKSVYESNASKYSLRAKAHKDMGNYRQAIEDFERAVNLNPEDAINSGEVDPDKPAPPGIWGKKDFDEIIKRFPHDYRGYMFRGLFYAFFTPFGAKTHPLAIDDYRRAISLNPNSSICHLLLGKIYYSQKIGFFATDKSKEDYITLAIIKVTSGYKF